MGLSYSSQQKIKIRVRLQDWWTAYNERNVEEAVKVFAENSVLFPAGGSPLYGRKAIQEFLCNIVSKSMAKFDSNLDEVQIMGKSHAFTVITTQTITSDGTAGTMLKTLMIWQKIGDTWFVVRDIYNASEKSSTE